MRSIKLTVGSAKCAAHRFIFEGEKARLEEMGWTEARCHNQRFYAERRLSEAADIRNFWDRDIFQVEAATGRAELVSVVFENVTARIETGMDWRTGALILTDLDNPLTSDVFPFALTAYEATGQAIISLDSHWSTGEQNLEHMLRVLAICAYWFYTGERVYFTTRKRLVRGRMQYEKWCQLRDESASELAARLVASRDGLVPRYNGADTRWAHLVENECKLHLGPLT